MSANMSEEELKEFLNTPVGKKNCESWLDEEVKITSLDQDESDSDQP